MDSEGESSDREEESNLSDSWQSGISPDLDLGRDDDEEAQACGGFDAGTLLQLQAPLTLVQQCCRVLGNSWAFEEVVQSFSAPIPDDIQQSIAFWAFPRDERKIKMYATLGNPSPDFSEAEQLLKKGRLKKMYQIGFQLCARFSSDHKIRQSQDVSGQSHGSDLQSSIHFNRGCITSCSCTCKSDIPWCSHMVATCLARVRYPDRIEIRPLLSASLMQLDQVQLQKFSQYLIARAPSDVLFLAQELLDEFQSPTSDINSHPGAPDITSGDLSSEEAEWLLDTSSMELILKEQATVLLSSGNLFLETPSLPDPVPDTVETFQRLLTAASYHRASAFRVNYLSMIASLLKERHSNAFALLRSATWALVDRIPTNSPLPLDLETMVCAMIADLAPLWMQAALAFPKLGMQIASSAMKFKTRLSKKWCFSANVHHLLDSPLAFVMHCANEASLSVCLQQPESTPTRTTIEDESSREILTPEGVTISSSSSEPATLAAMIQKKLHLLLSLSAPVLSPVNQVLSDDSQLGQMGPHALIAILTYLEHNSQEYGKACAEAVATWVFRQQRTEPVADGKESSDSNSTPICQLNPRLIVSTSDHMAFLQLARMVLQLLQRNVLSLTFALRVLLLPFSSQQAPLEMLVFNREQTVLDEIETHLTTCGSVEEPLTAFAVEAARSLLSCSVAVEQGQTTPSYGAALAVFSILTYGKEEDSQLCQLAYSMVLHFLRLNPISCSGTSTSTDSNQQRRDTSQFCVWKRFAALLLKVLLTCDACFGKEVTTMLEATFPLPADFETSVEGEHADKTLSPELEKCVNAATSSSLQPLLATEVWEEGEGESQEVERPPPAAATFPSPEKPTALAEECHRVATDPPGTGIPASLNLGVVYLLQELANQLLRMKESTGLAGMEKLAALELYLLCLRTRNCSNPHWGLEHYSSEEISLDLSKLIVHVGEPALLVLHRKWPLCLTPSCVVQGVSKACFLPDSQRLIKGFSAHAVCQIMKSALQAVKYMDFSSVQVALEICCKSRMKHAAEAMDILMSMPKHSISSEVLFCLASSMLEVHQYSLARLEEIEDGSYLVEQQPIIGEDWNDDQDETSSPAGPCSSILGTPGSKSLLGPAHQPSSFSRTLSTNQPCSQRTHACKFTHMAPPYYPSESTHTAVCIRKRRAQMQEFLHRAFRAGIRGLETLANERDDESLNYNHLKAPRYASDVRMLLEIACSMGNHYIRTFLQALPPAVGSPHVLYEASLTIAHHLSQNHPHQLTIHLRNQPLVGIVQDAMQKFAKCIEKQAHIISKNTSCQKEVVEMIREMEEMSKCYPTGDKELGNFLTSLVDGLKNNRKLRQLIMKEFQGYVHTRSFGGTRPLKNQLGHQSTVTVDIDPSPFLIACEMWDD